MPQIELQGQTIDYSLRRSARAKRISIRFDVARGFQIVYPLRVYQPTPAEVFTQKQAWVLKVLNNQCAHQERQQYQRSYAQGAIFQYLGVDLQLSLIEHDDQKHASVRRYEDRLQVKLPQAYMDNSGFVRAAIENYYRGEAKAYLPQRVKELAESRGFVYRNVRIKNQKTRWGSCSAKHNLNFNMRLMMAPPDAIDSVIIHELCHLKVLSHSKAFWNLVEKHCPDYKEWQKWFIENEHFLVF